jgi:hypothetical protein
MDVVQCVLESVIKDIMLYTQERATSFVIVEMVVNAKACLKEIQGRDNKKEKDHQVKGLQDNLKFQVLEDSLEIL